MKQTILIILLAFGMRAQSWQKFGEGSESGRVKHFYASAIGTTLIGNEINKRIDKPMLSTWLGGISMFGIGAAKEIVWDGMMQKGVKSKDDLFMNGWGCLTGMMVCRVVIDIKEKKHKHEKIRF
jgi:hypothetical protein